MHGIHELCQFITWTIIYQSRTLLGYYRTLSCRGLNTGIVFYQQPDWNI